MCAPRRARLRRALGALALGLIGAAAVLVAVVWWLSKGRPSWWRDLPPVDAAGAVVAEELENAVVNHLHAARPPDGSGFASDGSWRSESWSVSLQAADANAWLNSRLARWLSNRVPSVDWNALLAQSITEFHDGRIWIGSRIRSGQDSERVVAAVLRPDIRSDGSLWLVAENVSVGRLSLPAGWILSTGGPLTGLARAVGVPGVSDDLARVDAADAVSRALVGSRPLASDPVLRLADGRRVRLLAIVVRDDRLELTCRTEGTRR